MSDPRYYHTAYYMVRSATSQPYGGPEWPQRSGYAILTVMIESTSRAIARTDAAE